MIGICLKNKMEEDFDETPKWKKKVIVIGAIFMILLIISYFFTGYGVSEIIAGMIESDEINGNVVDNGEFRVIFLEETYGEILEIYNTDLSVETKMCLLGYFDGDYYVNEVLKPVIYSQEFNQVISEKCPDETLIALHSHPYRKCIASEQDLDNLEMSKEVNPNVIVGIICEEDRFNFYS